MKVISATKARVMLITSIVAYHQSWVVINSGMCTRPFRPRWDSRCMRPRHWAFCPRQDVLDPSWDRDVASSRRDWDWDVWWKPFTTTRYGSAQLAIWNDVNIGFKQFVIAVDSYAATNHLWLWTTLK